MDKKFDTKSGASPISPIVQAIIEALLQLITAWLSKSTKTTAPSQASYADTAKFLKEHRYLTVNCSRQSGHSTVAQKLVEQSTEPVLFLLPAWSLRNASPFPDSEKVTVRPISDLNQPGAFTSIKPCGRVIVDASGETVNQAILIDSTQEWFKVYPDLSYIVLG